MKYNPDIHHRRSIRLQGYDYSQAGLYFVTICVQNRECLFGEIIDGEMILNNLGEIAMQCWLDITQHFPNAILHEYVIMPNHVHGIIEIKTNDMYDDRGDDLSRPLIDGMVNIDLGAINRAPTGNIDNIGGFAKTKNPMLNNNLSRIVRWYKGRITFECHKIIPYFAWQRNYYENIIRNAQSYENISNYIINNPANWNVDKFYHL
ncbi:MAG: transposase [Bacteroidales bacterium]|jgi:REP element-mobilizing transposase RayT|nr:transposase [Bacteroidales bacterium]